MFEDGMDPLLDRNCADSGDEWEPPAKVTARPAPFTPGPPLVENTPTVSRGRGRTRSRGATRTTVPPTLPNGSSERWKNFDERDSVSRQFPFRPAREPGPQPRSRRHATLLDFFKLLFTDTILASLLENMNAFGSHQNENWAAVTMTDFYSFLAVVLHMGIVKLPEMGSYWRQHRLYNLPFPSAAMSRNKFMRMCRSLHLCSMEDDARNQALRGTPHYDRLAKVRPLYEQIVTACRDNYHPNLNISIDQLGSGYHLYVDDFYTSPHLFRDLFARQIGACGAIRTNRIGFPRTTRNDLSRGDPRGSVRWIRENELLFVKWKDTQEEAFCSTLHTVFSGDTAFRRQRQEGTWSLLNMPIPAAVKDYHSHVGGVDQSDALIGCYTVLHGTRKWYRTLFFHFLDIAVVNASILYNAAYPDRKLSQLHFREELISQLHQRGSLSTSTNRPQTQSATTTHIPVFFSEGKDINKANAASIGRRHCKLCHMRTPLGCETCNVPLCVQPTRNCYQQWHQDQGLL
uniref:PiggyBac transposable element-derived protein domain-containing protein n=1 Tax=Knipowitschia caucasica TaxID=637954 RepID=A0AAV2KF00_KNICA